jgi:hypothetical protein
MARRTLDIYERVVNSQREPALLADSVGG